MGSHHSTLAPRTPGEAKTRAHRPLAKSARRTAFKARRDALTRVRHDLRSLVHSVVGYSDLLAGESYGALSPDQARFVGHVRSAAEHLQELVDACIELSRPVTDARPLELPAASLGQALRRLRNGLVGRQLVCDLTLPAELETLQVTLDLPLVERALVGLALVITREGSLACALCARETEGGLLIKLTSSDAQEPATRLTSPDELADDTGNRDFVRLKLGEVLLARQSITLRVTPSLDGVELVLRIG